MASRPAETCKVAGSSNNSNNSIINGNNNHNSNSNNYIIIPIIFISMLKDQLAVLTAVRGLDYQGVRDPYQPREAGKTGPDAGWGPRADVAPLDAMGFLYMDSLFALQKLVQT